MKHIFTFFPFLALLFGVVSLNAQETYTRVESEQGLAVGTKVIIVGFNDDGAAYVMGYQKSNNRHAVPIEENGGAATTTVASSAEDQGSAYEFVIGGSSGEWTFYDELNEGYLYAASSSSNHLKTQKNLNDNGKWSISFAADGAATPIAQGSNERNIMRYNENGGSPLFSAYLSTGSVQAPVYIYALGGEPVIDPEPSNYPDDFYASVEVNSITLNWIDLGGAQLPKYYLIVGSEGTPFVPTDGVQYENNIDPNDGDLVYNVLYGNETFSFGDLEGNTTYNFAIFPYTNRGENSDYKTDGSYPTTSATTEDVITIVAEDFSEGLGVFTAYNIEGEQEWGTGSYDGVTYAKMSGYASQANHVNEDWLVSPDVAGNYESIVLNFDNAKNYEGDDIQVVISTDYSGSGDPTNSTWYDITSSCSLSTTGYEFVNSGNVNLVNFIDGGFDHLYFAFVYTSSDEASATWEIANVRVYGGAQGFDVEENEMNSIAVYPNPANDVIHFAAEADGQAEIIDMSGRVVMNVNVIAGETRVNVSGLNGGIYFIRFGATVSRFVKN